MYLKARVPRYVVSTVATEQYSKGSNYTRWSLDQLWINVSFQKRLQGATGGYRRAAGVLNLKNHQKIPKVA